MKLEYKDIIFDDWGEHENSIWASVCEKCLQKYKDKLKKEASESGSYSICSIEGCENEADYYVDFNDIYVKLLNNKL